MKKRIFAFGLALMMALSGCGKKTEEKVGEAEPVTGHMDSYIGMESGENEPDYTYTEMSPNVLVDAKGYRRNSTKEVFFLGGVNGQTFYVMDKATGNAKYSDKMVLVGTDESGRSICKGSFSEMIEDGEYYVVTDRIGQSYSFEIKGQMYREVFCELVRSLEDSWKETPDISKLREDCRAISVLLIAYEYYTGIFTDDFDTGNSGNNVSDLMDLISQRIRQLKEFEASELEFEELAAYIAVLSQFAQDSKNVNASFSEECLSKAVQAWEVLDKRERAGFTEDDRFYAAAQLYRACGNAEYRSVAEAYLEEDGHLSERGTMEEFYGKVAYLSTRYAVDINLCSGIISAITLWSEEIATGAGKDLFICAGSNVQGICENMQILSLINYVITNHEYVKLQENQVHYLLGRNPQGMMYLPVESDRSVINSNVITDNSVYTASVILMMCEIVQEELEE